MGAAIVLVVAALAVVGGVQGGRAAERADP
jgi:hypothetical protein